MMFGAFISLIFTNSLNSLTLLTLQTRVDSNLKGCKRASLVYKHSCHSNSVSLIATVAHKMNKMACTSRFCGTRPREHDIGYCEWVTPHTRPVSLQNSVYAKPTTRPKVSTIRTRGRWYCIYGTMKALQELCLFENKCLLITVYAITISVLYE